jgi:hypothetical protein
MPRGALWTLRQLFAQLLCQLGRISEILIINIDVFRDDRFDATAHSICCLLFFDPDRPKQSKNMARFDLGDLEVANCGVGVPIERRGPLSAVLSAPLSPIVLNVSFSAFLERGRRCGGRNALGLSPGRPFCVNDVNTGPHLLARRITFDPGVPHRQIIERAPTVPALFAIDPVSTGLVPRCRSGDDEIQAISIRIFSRRDKTGDIQRFELSSQRSLRKTVRQIHGKSYGQRSQFWRTQVS